MKAADPALAVRRALAQAPLERLQSGGRHLLVAVGKAAVAMMGEALRHVPDGSAAEAIAVTNYENARDISGAQVFAAGHPVPDENGLKAGQAVISLLQSAGAADRVLCLISGGGSALLPAPPADVPLADKIAVNQILLAHGFDIYQTNLVRQQLSTLKGGGMVRFAHPAPLRALIISDVIGDDMSCIASGPTAPPLGTCADAAKLLKHRGVWDKVPESARARLATENDAPPVAEAENRLVGSNRQSLQAIAAGAPDWAPVIVTDQLQGDVGDAAARIAARIGTAAAGRQMLIWGGETTVNLTGDGRGGRNQELALRVAMKAGEIPGDWVFLSGGTDGRDGPTDAAGGIVDTGTIARIAGAGEDIDALLSNNDSYNALQAAGDLLMTGSTGTNVADVQIFLRRNLIS